AGEAGLLILDIANPVSPTLVGTIATSAYGVAVRDFIAYVASYSGLEVFDTTNPVSPRLVERVSDVRAPIVMRGSQLLLVDATGGIAVLDPDDSAHLNKSVIRTCAEASYPDLIAVKENLLFVSFYGGVQIFDISSGSTPPTVATSLAVPGWLVGQWQN